MTVAYPVKVEMMIIGGTPPAWTEVTDYLRSKAGITMSWGGSGEDVAIEPSRASFTLDNSKTWFTPGRATSPYYPNIQIGARVQISVQVGGTWYLRFVGSVDEWTLGWESATDSIVDVTCTDDLKILSRRTMPAAGLFNEAVVEDHPNRYYPLTDPGPLARSGLFDVDVDAARPYVSGDGTVDWQGENQHPLGVYDDVIQFEPGTTGTAWLETTGSCELYPGIVGAGAVTSGVAFAAWIRISTPPAGLMFLFGATNFYLTTDQNSQRFNINSPMEGRIDPIVVAGHDPTVWHHVAIVAKKTQYSGINPPEPTYRHDLYLDGLNVWTSGAITNAAGNAYSLPSTQIRIGCYSAGGKRFAAASFAAYAWGRPSLGAQTDPPDFVAQYQAAQGYPSERSDVRIGRWLDAAGVPTANRVLDAGATTLGAQDSGAGDTSVLELATAAVESESGAFYVDHAGRFVFRNRDTTTYPTTVLASIPAANLLAYPTFNLDDGTLVNDVEVSGPKENPVVTRVIDDTSVAANGRRTKQVDTLDLDPNGPSVLARTLIRYEAWPTPQCKQVGLDLGSVTTGLATSLLSMVPGSILAITGCPTSAPAATVYLRCVGCTEAVTTARYVLDVDTTKADAYTEHQGGWRLDDVVLSVLGQTTILTI